MAGWPWLAGHGWMADPCVGVLPHTLIFFLGWLKPRQCASCPPCPAALCSGRWTEALIDDEATEEAGAVTPMKRMIKFLPAAALLVLKVVCTMWRPPRLRSTDPHNISAILGPASLFLPHPSASPLDLFPLHYKLTRNRPTWYVRVAR